MERLISNKTGLFNAENNAATVHNWLHKMNVNKETPFALFAIDENGFIEVKIQDITVEELAFLLNHVLKLISQKKPVVLNGTKFE